MSQTNKTIYWYTMECEGQDILVMSIRRDRSKKQLFINQRSFFIGNINNVIQQFYKSTSYPSFTPAASERLDKSESSEPDIELCNIPYREATGSLIYVRYTRPDIVFA